MKTRRRTCRHRIVAAVLAGRKTSTTGLLLSYQHDDEPLPHPGQRSTMIGSAGQPLAILEVTEVRQMPLSDIDLAHAIDEGEGYTTVAQWRAGHERFWHCAPMREHLGRPDFTVDDTTVAVTERLRVVSLIPDAATVHAAVVAESAALAEILTRRELQVALLISDGRCDKEIARKLGIGGYTVREHIRRMFAKLKISRRSAIVAAVLRQQTRLL